MAFCLVAAGCGDPEARPRASYNFDGLEVLSYDHAELCRGLLDDLESEHLRIREAIGAPAELPIRLAYGDAAVEELCDLGYPVAGCTGAGEGYVTAVASFASVSHELVHAHRHQVPEWRKPSFLEEGLAEVVGAGRFGGHVTDSTRELDLADAFELAASDLDTQLLRDGSHFVQWLVDGYGLDATVAMFSDFGADPIAVVELHFGASLGAIRQRWHDETEGGVARSTACDNVPTFEFAGETLVIELDTACGAVGSVGPLTSSEGPATTQGFCVNVADPVIARIELESAGGDASLFVFPSEFDCPEEVGYPDSGTEKWIVSDLGQDLAFGACRWRGNITSPIDEAGVVRVTLTPLGS